MIDFKAFYTEEEVVKLLQDMVAIPSHIDCGHYETKMADFVYEYCSNLGFECEREFVDGERNNVYVRLRGTGGGPTLLLNGHMDTVPPFNMTVDPYAGEIKDGCVWGRGTNDMKGALACMITAMAAIKRSGLKLKGDVLFTGVTAEEEAGAGTETFVLNGGTADGAIVGEPCGYEYTIGHRGLVWLEIKVEGVTVHGGQAQNGINAISMASRLIERINTKLVPEINKRQNEYMGPAIMNYGKIFGGDQVSTVAGECTIQIDRRFVPGETVDSVMAEYQAIIDELHAEDPKFKATLAPMPEGLMKELYLAPLIPQPESKIVKCVEKVLYNHLGEPAPMCTTRGWSDAATLSSFGKIPTVVFGPGNTKFSHTKNEHIAIEQLYNFTDFYANIAADFCEIDE